MEKITVTKIVNTKPDKFGTSVRVKTSEYADKRIFMISVKDANEIKVNGQYEGEGALWKEIEGTEWWSFRLPKKNGSGNPELAHQIEKLLTGQGAQGAKIDRIMELVTSMSESVEAMRWNPNKETPENY